MNYKWIKSAFIITTIAITIFQGCGNKKEKGDRPVVRIGKKTYMLPEYRSFQKMKFIYPVEIKKDLYPGNKDDYTLFVETVLFYRDAKKHKNKLKNNIEYTWRNIYLYGYLFQKTIINLNMGFSTEELEKAYFEIEEKTPGFFNEPSFSVARQKVAEHLFLKEFPPDSAYRAYFAKSNPKLVEKTWLDDASRDLSGFFSKYYYRKQYGKDYPSNPNDILGKNGIISYKELDIVLKWLPSKKKSKDEEKKWHRNIAKIMLGWKIFAVECKNGEYSKTSEFKDIEYWYSRYSLVSYYMNSVLVKSLIEPNIVDTVAIKYRYWDILGNSTSTVDTNFLFPYIDSLKHFQKTASLNEILMRRRKRGQITFFQSDMNDNLSYSPETLNAKIDTFVDDNLHKRAKKYATLLTSYYPKTEQGKMIYPFLADKYQKKSMYLYAIKYYRDYLISTPNAKDKDQIYSNIGYMYDKLGWLDLAAKNLQYLFKYTPKSSLISDAEFLFHHLGEPLPSIEELGAESKRRGGK